MMLENWVRPQLAIEGPQSLEVKSQAEIQTYHSIMLNSWKLLHWSSQNSTLASPANSLPSIAETCAPLQIEDSMEIDENPAFSSEQLPKYPLKRKLNDNFGQKRFRPNTIWVS